ncbi:MAG: hypothetical protein P4M09_06305 [Devosia sp.]|nr:hypothetical protein [Devosia sp.]
MRAFRVGMAGLLVVAAMGPALPTKAAADKMLSMPSLVVSLGCSGAKGDASQIITITNTTHAAIPKGTRIGWILGKAKGVLQLSASLDVGKTAATAGPAGKGGKCMASYVP